MFLIFEAKSEKARGKRREAGRPCMKADVRGVRRNRRVWSHLIGKQNIYETGTHVHTHTDCELLSHPVWPGNWSEHEPQTNEWHDREEMKTLLTWTINKPFGVKRTLMLEDENILKTWLYKKKKKLLKCLRVLFFTWTAHLASYSHHEARPTLQWVPHWAPSQQRHQSLLHTRSLSLALLLASSLYLPFALS